MSSDSVFHKADRTVMHIDWSSLTLVAEVTETAERVIAAIRGQTVIAARCGDHTFTLPFRGSVGAEAVRAGVPCQSTGRRREDLAATYLEDIGWQVLERNRRPNHGLCGELDIIVSGPGYVHRKPGSESITDPAQGQAGTGLVIVKVKTYSSLRQEPPITAVDTCKVARLRALVATQTSAYGTPPHAGTCLDIISILMRDACSALLHHHRVVDTSWGQLMRLL